MTNREPADDFPEAVRLEIAAHHLQYERDPAAAHLWDPIVIGVPGGPVPCLLLHHIGRKSGRQLNSILQYYRHANEIVVVGSKGGVANNPAWYLNLVAQPACEVQIGHFRSPAISRTLSSTKRAHWWPRITREQPMQLEYEKRTDREIPVVLLAMANTPLWP
ncbi:MAG: nitroreductase family deazaflavin-dependent oxidoreductase [Gammaproteobacteria bacterium]|nr:nitroreductase family deazaflavin-dependent oxidoreductase [Gammaproteobacteria bacterium]